MDLGRQLRSPQHGVKTILRSDIVLMSEAMKKTVMLELTVPWEDPMEKANEWMREKYEGFISDCKRQS